MAKLALLTVVAQLNAAFGGAWNKMAGTEQTGEYEVKFGTRLGRVGVRDLGGDHFRVRVEPIGATLELLEGVIGWKRPDSLQHRYSKVVDGQKPLEQALATALRALRGPSGRLKLYTPE